MKRSFFDGFMAGAILFFVLGLLVANQLIRLHHELSALAAGSNIYSSMAADLELGRAEHVQASLRVLAWVNESNKRYVTCMNSYRWYFFPNKPNETCIHFMEAQMPEDWQIPGLDKAIEDKSQ